MSSKKVLFPIDFSERSFHALRQAVKLISSKDDELILYHVYHRPSSGSGSDKGLLEQREERIDEKFASLEEHIPELNKVNVTQKRELGIFIDNLTAFIKQSDVDMIVMATEGAVGFGELWGTKTAKIIKSVDVPVLVVPDNTTIERDSTVALACDYSESTDYSVLKSLGKMAENFQWDIDVITLNREEKYMTKKEVENRETVYELLKDVPATFNFTKHADVKEGILTYCQEKEVKMLAILPKSYNYLDTLFHESLTQQMAFNSPIPLLVLK